MRDEESNRSIALTPLFVVVCVLAAAWPAPAIAQTESNRSRASERSERRASQALAAQYLRRGIAEYQRERYEQAVFELAAAASLEPTPLAYFYLGRCHDELGDVTAAVSAYEKFLASAPKSLHSKTRIAARRLASLRAAPGKLPEATDLGTPLGAKPRLEPEREPEPEPEPRPKLEPGAPPLAATGELPPPPTLKAVRASQAPQIDGILDDAEWRRAPAISAFTQKMPFGGQAPTEKTTLRLLYDDDAVYVAFDCEQVASPVVALLARRDRPMETDSVTIAFDSRAEGRSAFEFSVSAAGVLIDGIRFDDGKISREWDDIWEAKSEVRDHGWSAEFRIPLRVLRFEPEPEGVWHFQARRYISAKQELDEWAYVPLDVGGEVSHYGQLEGLRGLESHHSLELLPFVLGRARYQAEDPAIVRRGWTLRPSAGLDFKWHPANNLTVNGTVNPDFGQVEADQLILNLTTIEPLFPEKRPFFLSGMDDFATLTPIFYSRRIGRTPKPPPLSTAAPNVERLYDYPEPTPIYGAVKVAGDRSGGATVAALSAVTGPNDVDVVLPNGAREARLVDPLTWYNVLRVRTELTRGLDIGAIGTAATRLEPGVGWPAALTSNAGYPAVGDASGTGAATQRCPLGERTQAGQRCFHDAYVGSLDLLWRSPAGQYAIRGQGYASTIQNGPVRLFPDGTRIGSGDVGAGGTLRLSKQGGEHWLFDATASVHSRKADFNDLGFMDRQNHARAGLYAEYRTLEPALGLIETHTSALAYGENNLDGLSLGRGVLVMENAVLDSRWNLTLGGYASASHFDDREVGDGTALERASLLGAIQSVSTDPRRVFVLSAQATEEWLRNGANFSALLGVTWHPASRAELRITPTYTRNFGEPRYAGTGQAPTDLVFGRLHAESAGVTVRASYTFVPTLTLQSYAQLFLASGHYFDYAHFTAPAAGPRPVVNLADLVAGGPPAIRPDFEQASLAVNVVLAWEYHLGSTLYLLYARSQNPNVALNPSLAPRLDVNAVRTAPAADVIMLKIAYWIG